MRVAPREAFRVTPRWYQELNLGVGLVLFAAVTAYPWRGTSSALALAVAGFLAIAGGFVFFHSIRLARRANWRWIRTHPTAETVVFPKERGTATAIVLVILAAIYTSIDFSVPSPALRSGWWVIMVGGVAISCLLIVGWRARN